MGGFSGKPRTNDERSPGGVFIKKSTDGFKKKGEVLLVRFPAADGDDLVLFGDGRVELKDIGLNRVRNTVNFGGIGPEATSEGFPEIAGVRGLDYYGRQKF